MVGINPIALLEQEIGSLLTQYQSVFVATGMQMFRAFALINIVWFGLMSALDSTSGVGIPSGRFVRLLFRLSVGHALTTYYDVPLPGVGVSLVHLVVDQTQWMVNAISFARLDQLQQELAKLETLLPIPAFYEPFAWIVTFFSLGLIVLAEAAAFTVIAYGYGAMAVCILLGPVFVPFYVVADFEWFFWGWCRCFIAYSFYPVVAAAYVTVAGGIVVRVLTDQTMKTGIPMLDFGPTAVVLIAFIYGIFKIPRLVDGLFTGHSGDSAFPDVTRWWRLK